METPELVETFLDGETERWSDTFAWYVDKGGAAFAVVLETGDRIPDNQLEIAMGKNPEPDNGDPEYAFRVPVLAKEGHNYIAAKCFEYTTGNPGFGRVLYLPPDGWVPRLSYDDLSGIPEENIIGNDDAEESDDTSAA